MISKLLSILGLGLGLLSALCLSFSLTNLGAYYFLKGAPARAGTFLAAFLALVLALSFLILRKKASRAEAPDPLPLFLILSLFVGWASGHFFKNRLDRKIAEIKAAGIPTTFRELAPLSPDGRWGAEAYRMLMERHKNLLDAPDAQKKDSPKWLIDNLWSKADMSAEDWKKAEAALNSRRALAQDLALMLREQKSFQLFWAEEEEKFTFKNYGPGFAHMLHLSRLLILRARLETHSGNREAARADLDRALRLAQVSADQPTLIRKIIALALQSVVAKACILTGLPAPNGLKELGDRPLVSEGMKSEATGCLEFFRRMDLKLFRGSLQGTIGVAPEEPGAPLQKLWAKLLYHFWTLTSSSTLDTLNLLGRDEVLLNSPKDFSKKTREVWNSGTLAHAALTPLTWQSLLNLDAPSFINMYLVEGESDLIVSMIPLAEAWRVFRVKKGAIPRNLEAITPYLPAGATLEDPFLDPPGHLHVKNNAKGCVIYSVGRDGVDDGGSVDDKKDIGFILN